MDQVALGQFSPNTAALFTHKPIFCLQDLSEVPYITNRLSLSLLKKKASMDNKMNYTFITFDVLDTWLKQYILCIYQNIR